MRIIALANGNIAKGKGLGPTQDISIVMVIGLRRESVEITKFHVLWLIIAVTKRICIAHPLEDSRVQTKDWWIPLLI